MEYWGNWQNRESLRTKISVSDRVDKSIPTFVIPLTIRTILSERVTFLSNPKKLDNPGIPFSFSFMITRSSIYEAVRSSLISRIFVKLLKLRVCIFFHS